MKKEGVDTSISLKLNSYNDIFSNFDARPYSEKSLSDDFLHECKKASLDKGETIELKMFLPKNQRSLIEEIKIRKRLKAHFYRHYLKEFAELRKIKREGFAWFGVGIVLMFFSLFLDRYSGFFYDLLFIMAEPASWFMFWEGLDKVFITARQKTSNYNFYKKMSTSRIIFSSA